MDDFTTSNQWLIAKYFQALVSNTPHSPAVVKDDKLTPTPQGEPLIGLTDFDMMSVIGRGSYAKVRPATDRIK